MLIYKRGKISMITILFDLDGTLLQNDQKYFLKAYFKILSDKFISYGYDPEPLLKIIQNGIHSMMNNVGSETNENIFWSTVNKLSGKDSFQYKALFDEFYHNDFDNLKNICKCDIEIKNTIDCLKSYGYRMVIASNPVFPMLAQKKRISWVGLDYSDFIYITSYENSNYCKPNLNYYLQILENIKVRASDCLMVGNNVDEDMIAEKTGMKTFLLTNYLINTNNKDISRYHKGNFKDLKEFIFSLNNQY